MVSFPNASVASLKTGSLSWSASSTIVKPVALGPKAWFNGRWFLSPKAPRRALLWMKSDLSPSAAPFTVLGQDSVLVLSE